MMKIGGKHYRLTKNRKTLLQNLLLGAVTTALVIWCLHAFWIEFIYGIQW